jgi:membrane protein implicated in regulation of membrane protease activity
MIAGLVGFGVLYASAAAVMWHVAGAAWAVAYLISLPPTGLFAHAWVRALRRFGGQARTAWLMARLPLTRRHLVRMRARLIADIEAFRAEYRRDVLKIGERDPAR